MKKRLAYVCVAFAPILLLLVIFLSSGTIRRESTVRTFTQHRDLFEQIVELYSQGQHNAFWWDSDDLSDECPTEVRELLTKAKFQGVREWSGICFYKKENGVVSFGILYNKGNVNRTPFNQLYHIDGPWYYYIMDGTMI